MNLYLGLIGWLLFFVMCGIFWIAYKEAYEEEKIRQGEERWKK